MRALKTRFPNQKSLLDRTNGGAFYAFLEPVYKLRSTQICPGVFLEGVCEPIVTLASSIARRNRDAATPSSPTQLHAIAPQFVATSANSQRIRASADPTSPPRPRSPLIVGPLFYRVSLEPPYPYPYPFNGTELVRAERARVWIKV